MENREESIQAVRRKSGRSTLEIHRKNGVEYLTFPALETGGVARHLFSTRLGGVSEGHLGSMNLSYSRGDVKERVDENFRRIAQIMERPLEDFVFSDQTHTANVRKVTAQDRGKGLIRPRDYQDVDGFITSEEGIVLSTFYADCVPLFFVDPVKRAIGLSHSGWRGTVGGIGAVTVRRMQEEYGSRPEDILAAIGPSICRDCYEVGTDVAEVFAAGFPDRRREILTDLGQGKYLLDLWQANVLVLQEAGVLEEHISITDMCTCCNPKYLFSHRASRGRRGNLGAFLCIRPR